MRSLKQTERVELNGTEGELVKIRFALSSEPTLYQLQVHRDNFNGTYGDGTFEREFLKPSKSQSLTVRQLINHYGKDTVDYFLTEHLCIDLKLFVVARRARAK